MGLLKQYSHDFTVKSVSQTADGCGGYYEEISWITPFTGSMGIMKSNNQVVGKRRDTILLYTLLYPKDITLVPNSIIKRDDDVMYEVLDGDTNYYTPTGSKLNLRSCTIAEYKEENP